MPTERFLELLKSPDRLSATQQERAGALLQGRPDLSDLQAALLLLEKGVVSRDEADSILGVLAAKLRSADPGRDLSGRVLGKYRLVRRLSRSGRGPTYFAEHAELGVQAAVRIFPRAAGEERLRAEALRLAKIDHPHLARVLDFGSDDEICYLATSFVEGASLEDFALLPDPAVATKGIAWMRQIAGALQALHRAGLVHGELSPAAILVESEGPARLAGCSLSAEPPDRLLLAPVEGAPTYAARERLRGDPADPKGDLYSLGAVFYGLIARQPPLPAATYGGLFLRQCLEKPSPDPLLRAGVDPAGIAAILRLLDRDPATRFPDAGALLAAIPVSLPKVEAAPPSAPVLRASRKPPPAAVHAAPRAGRDPLRIAIAALSGVFLVLILLLGFALRGRGAPKETRTAGTSPNPTPESEAGETPPARPDRSEDRQRLVESAERARQAGRFEEAVRLLRDAERIHRSADLTQLIRTAEDEFRRFTRERAEYEHLERTLSLLPDDAALEACDNFLQRSGSSSFAEKVLLRKQDLIVRIDAARIAKPTQPGEALPPPPPPVAKTDPARPVEPPKTPGTPGRSLPPSVRDGLLWLARHQNDDGSWSIVKHVERCTADRCTPNPGHEEYDPGVSALAVLAILGAGIGWYDQDQYEGVNLGDTLRRGVQGLLASRALDGAIGTQRGHKHVYSHAVGTQALAEAVRSLPPDSASSPDPKVKALREGLSGSVEYLLLAQNASRGWRYGVRPGDNDSSVTAMALTALDAARRAGFAVTPDAFRGGLAWFQECQEYGGRVGYTHRGTGKVFVPGLNENFDHHETLTAAALACRTILEGDRKDPSRAEMLQLILRDPPAQAGNALDGYWLYWATRAVKEAGSPGQSEAWRDALVKLIGPRQSREPLRCRRGSWEPVDRWSPEGGRVFITAIHVLTLEHALLPRAFDFRRSAAPALEGSGPPAVPPGELPWIFVLKSGGQLRVHSYEEREGKYTLRLATGKTTVAKEDVLQIQKAKP